MPATTPLRIGSVRSDVLIDTPRVDTDWRPSPAAVRRLAAAAAPDGLARRGLRLEITAPGDPRHAAVVAEVRAFRGRGAWDPVLRPQFRLPDGTFHDPDGDDPVMHQIVLRDAGGAAVGCVRGGLLADMVEHHISALHPAAMDALVAGSGGDPRSVLEAGRLVVDPDRRGAGLAPVLVLAIGALGRLLGTAAAVCAAGTARQQYRIMLSTGWEVRPEFGFHAAPELADMLCVMALDPHRDVGPLEPTVVEMTSLLSAV